MGASPTVTIDRKGSIKQAAIASFTSMRGQLPLTNQKSPHIPRAFSLSSCSPICKMGKMNCIAHVFHLMLLHNLLYNHILTKAVLC